MRVILALIIVLSTLFSPVHVLGQEEEIDSTNFIIQQIEESLEYQDGTIELESGNALIHVPSEFRFLGKEQANYVLSDLWGNPPDDGMLGLLVPRDKGVLGEGSWVFTISFDEMGYVKDDDADDIDYDELLEEQRKEMRDANPERIEQGYPEIEFVGWASRPYYDKSNKILHWAKELNFDRDTLNTLNYNLRVLGRKGIFLINAVASMNEMPEVKASIDEVIASVEFTEGNRYIDFLPDVDNVATWTVGGLVAGKVLAKVGFFAVILKFWKLIALAVAGFGGTIWNKLRGKKKEKEIVEVKSDDSSQESNS